MSAGFEESRREFHESVKEIIETHRGPMKVKQLIGILKARGYHTDMILETITRAGFYIDPSTNTVSIEARPQQQTLDPLFTESIR
ncbi:hypothetical protein JXL21_05075 [Candidatus Bathyarchaeota archaeon]|nr:hypothetical protein [Candidatus Bathyarchaeota archaeon]